MQTDVRPRVEAGRFALVALPFVLVALPSALAALPSVLAALPSVLAGFAQVRALLPVATSVALEETRSVGL